MASNSTLRHAASVPNSGALLDDALYEVLLRLPAKELCRLRTVCRSWRALTSDPRFAAAHKSHHPEPLFAVIFGDGDDRGVAIMGLSGQVLRRTPPFASNRVDLLLTHLDRVCVVRGCKPSLVAWVVNPSTGAAVALPGLTTDLFVRHCTLQTYNWGSVGAHYCKTVTYALGQVASTGAYKVLRISHPEETRPLLSDVITIEGNNHGGWRRKQNPPFGFTRHMNCLALNGVVYFVLDAGSIAPFNLETEEWMQTIRGPEPLRIVVRPWERMLKLANLNGSLVMVDNVFSASFDLWFLMDREHNLWVKRYSLSIEHRNCHSLWPLLVLDDGRIVIFERSMRRLQCYDPATGNLINLLDLVEMGIGESQSISVYTGSLLI